MKYQCPICNTKFDEPFKVNRTERIHEFMAHFVELSCPICGSPYFDELDTCPRCKGDMLKGEIICKYCRKDLLKRLNAFADYLYPEEEEQLDEWLDGESITNRKNWR